MLEQLIKFTHRCTAAATLRLYWILRRLKLKGTVGASLENGYLDSFELLQIVKSEIQRDDIVIYDIGGHIGKWTVLAKSIFPLSEVHIFEPLPEHLKALSENTNNLTKVNLHKYALGNKNETAVMNVTTSSDSSSLLGITGNMLNEYGQVKVDEAKVEVMRLSDFVKQNKIKIPQLIKLDVQGYELEVLNGAADMLKDVTYLILEVSFVEFYKGQPLFEEIINALASKGFRLHAFGKNTAVGKRIIQTDVLFKATGNV